MHLIELKYEENNHINLRAAVGKKSHADAEKQKGEW